MGCSPSEEGVPCPQPDPPYPPEFRAEAVRLVRTSGKTLKEIAADLGVSTESLRKWVRQADDAGQREGLTTAERKDREANRIQKVLEGANIKLGMWPATSWASRGGRCCGP